jgi:hypothetical protein
MLIETWYFDALERTIQFRHELIHNLDSPRVELADLEWQDLDAVVSLITGCDIVLSQFIAKNLDIELRPQVANSEAYGI